jgi:hypothetical protein
LLYIVDITYSSSSTTDSTILFDVQQRPSKALCHIAEWTNSTFINISPDIQEGCLQQYYIQPSFQEYLQIALSLFERSDNENLEIILLINVNFGEYKLVYIPTFYWSPCTKPGEWAIMYVFIRSIDLAYFYDFSIGFWNGSDSVVFFILYKHGQCIKVCSWWLPGWFCPVCSISKVQCYLKIKCVLPYC